MVTECPPCLGKAHLLEDVESPCLAELDLPLEERSWRAGLEQPPWAVAASPPPTDGRLQDRVTGHSRKRQREHSHGRCKKEEKKQASKGALQPVQCPAPAPVATSGQEDIQMQILSAIRGLTDRVVRIEAQSQIAAFSEANIPGRASPTHLSSCQEPKANHPDSISLYAHGSLFE